MRVFLDVIDVDARRGGADSINPLISVRFRAADQWNRAFRASLVLA
jgi:hypothetical protein